LLKMMSLAANKFDCYLPPSIILNVTIALRVAFFGRRSQRWRRQN